MNPTQSVKIEFGLIFVGAIIFTISFMWKDLLTDIEEAYFPKESGLFGRTIYTLVITMCVVYLVVYLKNLFGLNNHKIPEVTVDSTDIKPDDIDESD